MWHGVCGASNAPDPLHLKPRIANNIVSKGLQQNSQSSRTVDPTALLQPLRLMVNMLSLKKTLGKNGYG